MAKAAKASVMRAAAQPEERECDPLGVGGWGAPLPPAPGVTGALVVAPFPKILASGEPAGIPNKPGQRLGWVLTLQAGPSWRERVVFILGRPEVPFILAAMSSQRHWGVLVCMVRRLEQQEAAGTCDAPCT